MWLKGKTAAAELEPETAAPPQQQRKGWFEKRRERRKRRRLFEEIVAWIFVPALLYGCYLLYHAVGGLPPAAFEFMGEVTSMVLRGGK
ncbi:MAG: hypothetical protein ACRCWO_04295 [Bosea sp. (in: a-proteobacteria)]